MGLVLIKNKQRQLVALVVAKPSRWLAGPGWRTNLVTTMRPLTHHHQCHARPTLSSSTPAQPAAYSYRLGDCGEGSQPLASSPAWGIRPYWLLHSRGCLGAASHAAWGPIAAAVKGSCASAALLHIRERQPCTHFSSADDIVLSFFFASFNRTFC